MVYNIHIQINRRGFYLISKITNPLSNKVTEYEPFDTKSKKFNKYTHVIQYKERDYNPSDYVLCLDDPNAWYYYYILFIYKPSKKIVSVDIFFQSNDKDKRYPLIFGFNYEKDPSVYYTYYHLRGLAKVTDTIGNDGLIEKSDLITRLIDERGLYESESYNKFIIRLGDKPNDTRPVIYPKSGQNKGRITLQKSELQQHQNYVKLDHDINRLNNVESFYLSFHQDTLYMIGDSSCGKLNEVHVYYNKYDGAYPVVVVLKFERRTKLYRFSYFIEDLPKKTKKVAHLDNFSENELKQTLIEEFKNVNKEITFYQGKRDNKYISVTSERYNQGNKDEFRRAILRPNLDTSKDGHSSGPYEVYNDNLFQKYSKTKISEDILGDIFNSKFSSIYVYYTAKNEPLLVGFIGESDNKFVRISKGGKSWERDTDSLNIYTLSHLYSKLVQLEKDKNEKVAPPPRGRGSTHQPGRTTSRPAAPPVSRQTTSTSINIDISKTSGSSYDPGNVQLSRNDYDVSDLFCFFRHSLKATSTFTLSSLSYGSGTKISNTNFSNKVVQSVKVYFNTNHESTPLMIEFDISNSKSEYYEVVNTRGNYTLKQDNSISKGPKLCDKLIELNDKNNSMCTFQIDKIEKYNSVNVSPDKKSSHQFTIYKHSPPKPTPTRFCVLIQRRLLVVDSSFKSHSRDIHNKKYDFINVYAINADSNYPLVVELKESNSGTEYFIRKDSYITFKKVEDFKPTPESFLKTKLDEIYYVSSKSVILEINRNFKSGDSIEYDLKLIDNKSRQDRRSPSISDFGSIDRTHTSTKLKVKEHSLSCTKLSLTSFRSFYHDLSGLVFPNQNPKISGIRLSFPKSFTLDTNMVEVELYKKNSVDPQDRYFINFFSTSLKDVNKNRFYVYFFIHDPRPILIQYDNVFFRPINDSSIKWYHDTNLKQGDNCNLLTTLKQIHDAMKKKMVFVKDGVRSNIKVERNATFGHFKKDTYTPELSNKDEYFFTLSKDFLLHERPSDKSNIDELLDKLDNSVFDTVNVYMNKTGSSLKDVVLFEFINESHKIHLKPKDEFGNYWVEQIVSYSSNEQLQKELQSIHSSTGDTIVYEIDPNSTSFYSTMSEMSTNDPIEGITKYTFSPKDEGEKTTTILFKGKDLMEKSGGKLQKLSYLTKNKFSSLTVYFGSRAKDGSSNLPLIIELHKAEVYEPTVYFYRRIKTEFFWEKIDSSLIVSPYDIIGKLSETEFKLADSIVLLMDKTKVNYGDPEIKKALQDIESGTQINLPSLDRENIRVYKDSTRCISKYGFYAYKHDLRTVKNKDKCGLRFFIRSGFNSGKYVELTLYYDQHDQKDYLFYEGQDSVFFYFYGEDPRPLLLFYGVHAYRATDINGYNHHIWFRDHRISDALCKNGRDNPDLINSLSDVVAFLNPVNLENRFNKITLREPNRVSTDNITYDAYNFNRSKVQIKVSYENKACYRVYHHESNGINGSGRGFRLGNITYGNRGSEIGIYYNLSKQLNRVSVYYNLFDYKHQFPILVSLRYSDTSYDYYELAGNSGKFWIPIEENVLESDVETKAYDILENLDIKFERKEGVETLFNPDECKEGGTNAVAVIGGSVGGVISTAAVGGGVTVAVRPELIITSIRALV